MRPENMVNSPLVTILGDPFLPKRARPGAHLDRRPRLGPIVSSTTNIQTQFLQNDPLRIEFFVEAPTTTRLTFARWAFEGWFIDVNQFQEPAEAGRFGEIEFAIPNGESHVIIWYETPLVRTFSLLFSVFFAGVWVILYLRAHRAARIEASSGQSP
jgi:hypothetical protein